MRWAELGPKSAAGLRHALSKRTLSRVAKVAALTLAALYVVYLVAANALLKLGGVAWFVNSGTDAAHLALRSAHTWIPGRVEVNDLALRFEDPNVQFQIVVARARGSLDLVQLARKRLHFYDLEAEGVRFLFRHKLTGVAGNERRLVHFPRIEGFSDPPILKPEPRTDKTKNWVIELENVHAHGVELWFMEYRYTGSVEVTGGFRLAPGRSLHVGPAHMEFVAGALGVGAKRPLARNVRGKLDFGFRETNPDPIPGLEIFRQISAKFALDAELYDLEAMNLYLSDASNLAVRRGRSALAARLELRDGRFVPESFIAIHGTEDVNVVLPTSVVSGRFEAEVRARAREKAPPRLVVDGSFERAAMSLGAAARSEPPDVSVRAARATIATDHADVARPWKLEEASFRVEGGKIDDLRVLEAASEDRVLEAGSAWFFANAELAAKGSWTAAFRADARRVRVRLGDRRSLVEASLAAAAESPRRDLSAGTLGDVSLDVTSAPNAAKESGVELHVRAPRVDWSGFPPTSARGRATLQAPHIEPLFEAVGAPSMLVSLWPDAPIDASARFAYENDALDVRLDRAKSGAFRAMGKLVVCSPPRAAFLVKSGVFSVGLSIRNGAVSVIPLAGDDWLKENAPVCASSE